MCVRERLAFSRHAYEHLSNVMHQATYAYCCECVRSQRATEFEDDMRRQVLGLGLGLG